MKKCVFLVLVVSLILAWNLNSAIGAEKVLKLGASVCLTGRLAKEGNYVKDGYTLWQEEVNKKMENGCAEASPASEEALGKTKGSSG